MKILLAVDDSIYSEAAADVVVARDWPAESSFKVISVVDENEAKSGQTLSAECEIPAPGSPAAIMQLHARIEGRLKERYPRANISSEVVFGYCKEKILDC